MTTPDAAPQARRVLVAYASRSGATAEIAQWLAERLRSEGEALDVTVAEVSDALDPSGYDVVVLGSALYEGRWLRSASRFARRHRHDLDHAWVWTFSSGPLDDSASTCDIAATNSADRASRHLLARDHVTFGGRLAPDSRGWLAHAMVEGGHGGDFRDRARIDAYADQIAGELSMLPRHRRPAA
ncbi:flavodoxin domain-containing protein [Streptacidiphilus anmyonensis]|uniref:flavodoxin domain-containing protein n=1 Tax=Streptacidiphilus anmyonensis TaxID=405782 RepID=UPI0005A810AA|nr:flavodoxin domain-containing protein [Streptacidiphilus anmyonensis]